MAAPTAALIASNSAAASVAQPSMLVKAIETGNELLRKLLDRGLPSHRTTLIALGSAGFGVMCLPLVSGFFAYFFAHWSRPALGHKAAASLDEGEFGDRQPTMVFDLTRWTEFQLIDVQQLTHDVRRYRFAMPAGTSLNLAPARHVHVAVPDAATPGQMRVRPYSPVSLPHQTGSFDLVIKEYPTGGVSAYLSTVPVGGRVLMRGPRGSFKYTLNELSHIGLLAGGTGITPMLQLIRHVLSDPRDTTCISLLFANHSPADIILKDELDSLATHYPSRFRMMYVCSAPAVDNAALDAAFVGARGRIDRALIQDHMPAPTRGNVRILVCGPESFNLAMRQICSSVGYSETQVYTL